MKELKTIEFEQEFESIDELYQFLIKNIDTKQYKPIVKTLLISLIFKVY